MNSWGGAIFLGDGFFNRFYTYVDLEQNKVGIAQNKENLTIEKILTLNDLGYEDKDWEDWGDLA